MSLNMLIFAFYEPEYFIKNLYDTLRSDGLTPKDATRIASESLTFTREVVIKFAKELLNLPDVQAEIKLVSAGDEDSQPEHGEYIH